MENESHEQLLRRIQGEYLEMPGLQLTRQQAQRLWALDEATCAMILDTLVDRRFLVCGSDNRYRQMDDASFPGAYSRMAKANLAVRIRAERFR
jgi:hypothetical protein